MKIRAIVVDDEPLAREGVALALQDESDIEIVASCADGSEAVRAIRAHAPDLVFLDIKMPGLSGFDVVEAVGAQCMPAVIFLTAYEEHALRAFRVNAVDYLLKPIDADAFGESLQRARRRLAQDDAARRTEQLRGLLRDFGAADEPNSPARERIVVRAGGRVYFLSPEEITWVEAAGDYVTIHTRAKAHLIRDSMKNMETRLTAHGFQRIHRSALVNLGCVHELMASDTGEYRVVLHDGTPLPLSRNYRDSLYSRMKAVP